MIHARVFGSALAVLLCGAAPLMATVLCMGTGPAFLMTVAHGQAQFDYLGDGWFEVLPPVAPEEVLRGPRTHVLVTSTGRIPMLLTPGACPVQSITTPLGIELLVDTAEGKRSFVGCCLVRP
jgi:hypothetical protein